MVIIVMGVSGSGKTAVGRAAAAELGWEFHNADDEHPAASIEKMLSGKPLNPLDRAP
jgi:gluconokinase